MCIRDRINIGSGEIAGFSIWLIPLLELGLAIAWIDKAKFQVKDVAKIVDKAEDKRNF